MLYKSGVYAQKVLSLTPGGLSVWQQKVMSNRPERSNRQNKDQAHP